MKLIRNVDAFGAPVELSFHNKSKGQSFLGGITTLLLYGISLVYALYVFIQWGNGQLVPMIQTQSTTLEYASVTLPRDFMVLGFNDPKVDPFSFQDNIFLPLLYEEINGARKYKQVLFSESSNIRGYETPLIRFPQLDLKIKPFAAEEGEMIQYFLIFTPCKAIYYDKCADESKQAEFLENMPQFLEININLKQYNAETNQNDLITKSQYQAIDSGQTVYNQIFFKTTEQTIDNGVLFDSYTSETQINNFELIAQTVSNEFSAKIFGVRTYLVIFIRLNTIQDKQLVVKPKLGEVLGNLIIHMIANIGSIVSLLLLTKIGIMLVNQLFLENDMTSEFIQFYYKDYKDLRIEKSIFGKVKSVVLHGKQMDVNQFNDFYTRMKTKLNSKLNVLNQVYEMSRMQILLLKEHGRESVLQTLRYSAQLPIALNQAQVHPEESLTNKQTQQQPSVEDIFLFDNNNMNN